MQLLRAEQRELESLAPHSIDYCLMFHPSSAPSSAAAASAAPAPALTATQRQELVPLLDRALRRFTAAAASSAASSGGGGSGNAWDYSELHEFVVCALRRTGLQVTAIDSAVWAQVSSDSESKEGAEQAKAQTQTQQSIVVYGVSVPAHVMQREAANCGLNPSSAAAQGGAVHRGMWTSGERQRVVV